MVTTRLPKELLNLIWEYKHSAKMYDVAMEFKKWFYLPDTGEVPFNLYNIEAFNYRMCEPPWYFICNIFQDGGLPVGVFGQIPKDQMTKYMRNKLLKIEENRKVNWRQEYIDTFDL